MRKSLGILSLALALLIVAGVAVVSANSGATVYTRGDEILKQNVKVEATLRFSPGPVTIKSGDTVTWTHADKTDAPHTVTIATPNQLVTQFVDLFLGTCPDCDAAIGAASFGHFVLGLPVLDPDNDGEFISPGDSKLFFHGETVSAQINAPAGTTLYYFCALHPWMIGSIQVK